MGFIVANIIQSPGEMLRDLGGRIRERRIAARLSQLALGKRAGVSRDTIVRLENGFSIGLMQVVQVAFALDAVDEFGGLFPRIDTRSLDEILAAQRRDRRVRIRN